VLAHATHTNPTRSLRTTWRRRRARHRTTASSAVAGVDPRGPTHSQVVPSGRELHAKYLTHFKGGTTNAFAGSFAPDGKRIVFRLQKGNRSALATIRRDGGKPRLLSRMTREMPRYIDWGTHP
jgi:hypothetical protein